MNENLNSSSNSLPSEDEIVKLTETKRKRGRPRAGYRTDKPKVLGDSVPSGF